jgi:Domain of unknown function (DUF1876)
MSTTKRWTVEILLDEVDEGTTRAVARLDTSDDAHLHGRGTWRRADEEDVANVVVVSEVGDDVAVSQALAEIAHKLAIRASAATRASATLASVVEA